MKLGEGRDRHLPLSPPFSPPPVSHVKGLNKGVGEEGGSDERGKNSLLSGLEGHLVIAWDEIKNNNHDCQDRAHGESGSALVGRW